MMLLPKDVGPFTLVRKLGTGAVAESYLGTMNTDGGRSVVVRRILPYVLRDPGRKSSTEARVRDLMGVRHPFLVQVLSWVEDGDERFIVEDHVAGIDLERVLGWCRAQNTPLPHNVFLNIATQVCNGLEALHGRPGRGSGADNVLHLGLKPAAIMVNAEGKVILGGFGLTRSPTTLSHGGVSSPVPSRMEYLSPEQTQPDQKLTPASDIFALGAILYELLTLQPLFRSDSNLQTINRIRRAEVTSELLQVKDLMPGLDKVLYRALSANPRHRYQRAFVLREDLRGLMAGYSFASIVDDTRAFFAPMLDEAADKAPATAATATVATATVATATAAAGAAAATAAAGLQVQAVGDADDGDEIVGDGAQPDDELSGDELSGDELSGDELNGDEDAADDDSGEDSGTASVSVGLGVAPPAAGGPPVVPGAPPPSIPTAPPPADEFADDIATRIDRKPNTTAALAADALRAHLREEVEVEEEATASAPAAPPPADPVDEIPPTVAGADDEDLADRSTLPIPPGTEGFDDVTDVSALAAAGSGTNSTRAFLRGEGDGAAPPPPPALPDPAASGIDTRHPPAPQVPPPSVPAKTPRSTPAAPPPTVPPPATSQPASGTLSARLAAAPPPQATTPPPAAPPAPVGVDDDDDEGLPRKSGNGMVIGVAALVAALILVCGVGGFFAKRLANRAADDALASLDEATADEATADEATADEATADEATADEATADQATADEATADQATTDQATADATPSQGAATSATRRADDQRVAAASPTRPQADSHRSTVSSGRSSGTAGHGSSTSRRSPSSTSGRSTASSARRTSASSTTSADNDDVLADLDLSTDEVIDEDAPVTDADIEAYADPANSGRLSSSDVMSLEMVGIDDPAYTRSRALLLMNAQRKGDDDAAKRYLDQLMLLPENQYNPVYLSDLGRYLVNRKQYSAALEKADLAERYWARLPSELVFSKKAEIYETQAAAWQGRFYQSEDDLELLEQAIRHWQKYRDHVQTKSRSDLARRADAELAKLEDIRTRLH